MDADDIKESKEFKIYQQFELIGTALNDLLTWMSKRKDGQKEFTTYVASALEIAQQHVTDKIKQMKELKDMAEAERETRDYLSKKSELEKKQEEDKLKEEADKKEAEAKKK